MKSLERTPAKAYGGVHGKEAAYGDNPKPIPEKIDEKEIVPRPPRPGKSNYKEPELNPQEFSNLPGSSRNINNPTEKENG